MTTKPYIGMPATIAYMTDRHAGTVIAVSKTGYKVTVQEDHSIRTDSNGMSECQEYTYRPNSEGLLHVFYRGDQGNYSQRGKSLWLGARRSYYDYSF